MTSKEELAAQLEATRRQLDDLTNEVARNDEIMRRAQGARTEAGRSRSLE